MTQQDYKELLHQLPENIIKEYDLNPDYGFDGEKCIRTNDYEYYPEIPCILIDGVPITWDKDLPYINPRNKQHLTALKERIKHKRHESIGIIRMTANKDNPKLYCILSPKTYDVSGLKAIPFDESAMYYDPAVIDLENDNLLLAIAKVIFTADRYDTEYIVPSKDLNPKNWTAM